MPKWVDPFFPMLSRTHKVARLQHDEPSLCGGLWVAKNLTVSLYATCSFLSPEIQEYEATMHLSKQLRRRNTTSKQRCVNCPHSGELKALDNTCKQRTRMRRSGRASKSFSHLPPIPPLSPHPHLPSSWLQQQQNRCDCNNSL